MPQFSYSHPIAVNGQIADATPRVIDSYINELLAQKSDIPIGGTTDGTYTIQIVGEEGTFTVSFVAVAQTANQIADGLEAAVLANVNLVNIVSAATTSGTPVHLIFLHTGMTYTISFPSNPGGNMSHTLVQAAGGTNIELGVAIVQGAQDDLAKAPISTSTDANCVGLTIRNIETQINEGIATNTDVIPPGATLSALREGTAWVECEDAAPVNGNVFVRRVATGTEKLGAIRASRDGTARVETVTPTAANSTQYSLRISVDRDGNGDWEQFTIGVVSDASATATEISDGLRTSLAQIDALTGIVTGSGTTTLVLTGAAGVKFESNDLGPGVLAVAETTAGVFDTFRLTNAIFKSSTSAAGLAKVRVNRS